MKKKLLPFLLLVVVLTSCTTNKMLTSSVPPEEVNDIQYFDPISFLSLIENGNKSILNDSLSNVAKNKFLEALTSVENIPLAGYVSISDPVLKERLNKEIEFLCVAASKQKKIDYLSIPQTLDSLLESNGKRFGLIAMTSGFTRGKGNYAEELTKGIALGIVTLGMAYYTPVKATSSVYIMIVDAQENDITFFRGSYISDSDPLNKKTLQKQIRKIFDDYFLTKKEQ